MAGFATSFALNLLNYGGDRVSRVVISCMEMLDKANIFSGDPSENRFLQGLKAITPGWKTAEPEEKLVLSSLIHGEPLRANGAVFECTVAEYFELIRKRKIALPALYDLPTTSSELPNYNPIELVEKRLAFQLPLGDDENAMEYVKRKYGPKKQTIPKKPFRFLDLPARVQRIVFGYLLVVDGAIPPYRYFQDEVIRTMTGDPPKPQLNVMSALCKRDPECAAALREASELSAKTNDAYREAIERDPVALEAFNNHIPLEEIRKIQERNPEIVKIYREGQRLHDRYAALSDKISADKTKAIQALHQARNVLYGQNEFDFREPRDFIFFMGAIGVDCVRRINLESVALHNNFFFSGTSYVANEKVVEPELEWMAENARSGANFLSRLTGSKMSVDGWENETAKDDEMEAKTYVVKRLMKIKSKSITKYKAMAVIKEEDEDNSSTESVPSITMSSIERELDDIANGL